MQPTESLVWYGYLVIAMIAGLVLIPYLRGKTDLITGWNFVLVGFAIYTGLGCLAAVYREFSWGRLTFQPTRGLVNWYLAYSTIFFIALFASYYYFPISAPLASRSLQKWPPFSLPLVLYVLVFSSILVVVVPFVMSTPFLGQVIFNLAHKGVMFSVIFAFALWYRNKANAVFLAVLIGILIAAGLYSMLVSVGRRMLLSVVLGPIVYVYWVSLRYWKPKTNLLWVGTAAAGVLLVGAAYNSFRHFSKGVRGEERTVATIVKHVESTNIAHLLETSSDQILDLPQQVVQYGMLVRRSVEEGRVAPRPLNTLIMVAVYPIPRAIWPGKPRTIGDLLPTEVLRVRSKRGLNWGVGPAGQAAYEGGVPTLVLYAVLATIGIRFLDEPLKRQPSNPFLISILASSAPHLVGWPRGDMFILTVETIECVIFAIILGIGGRILFGTEQTSTQRQIYASPIAHGHSPPGGPSGP